MNNQSKQRENKLITDYTSHTDYPENTDTSARRNTINYLPDRVIVIISMLVTTCCIVYGSWNDLVVWFS